MRSASRAGDQCARSTYGGTGYRDRFLQRAAAFTQLLNQRSQRRSKVLECPILTDKSCLENLRSFLVLHIDPPMPGLSLTISDQLSRYHARVVQRGIVVRQINANLVEISATTVSQIEKVSSHGDVLHPRDGLAQAVI